MSNASVNSRGGGAMDKSTPILEITLDFSPLLVKGEKFAVYCETQEDAIIFLRCYRAKYPDKCRTWKEDDTHFGSYERHCYRPNLNMPAEWTLKYCSYEHYEEEGFTIIPFQDLIVHPDIEESDLSMDVLFGGIV